MLCSKPYASGQSGWKIEAGAIPVANAEKIKKNITYYQGWKNGLYYVKGDIVRTGFGDQSIDTYWLCTNDLTCSVTQPATGQTVWTQTKTGYNVDPENGLAYAKRKNFLYADTVICATPSSSAKVADGGYVCSATGNRVQMCNLTAGCSTSTNLPYTHYK